MLGAYTPTEAQLAHEAEPISSDLPADKLDPLHQGAARAAPALAHRTTGGVDLNTAAVFSKRAALPWGWLLAGFGGNTQAGELAGVNPAGAAFVDVVSQARQVDRRRQ